MRWSPRRSAKNGCSTPAAISVFSADFIENNRVETLDDLIWHTPGLTGTTYGASNPTIVIRGLSGNDFGSGADATFGVYLNEVLSAARPLPYST
jgi:outer membrane receptor for ferric coprogen and ferric-rhodotorulic acid